MELHGSFHRRQASSRGLLLFVKKLCSFACEYDMIIIFIRIVVCGGQAMTNRQIVDARNLGFYMTAEERIVFPVRGT